MRRPRSNRSFARPGGKLGNGPRLMSSAFMRKKGAAFTGRPLWHRTALVLRRVNDNVAAADRRTFE